MKPIGNTRCAVYTRKSTEHNLDLEFNSLDAQREACEAYIKSQIHEGWRLIPDHYDDGGISGGSLDRPDLQKLLADIRGGKVDTVVVYKVDRLTRSLTDFAKLVDLFDVHRVSFVSVTQAFNTTTSMGRLTLNVLLSFAQFEREVIGERVRDKVAASKRKGLWMGGTVPLGYTNQDKKLVIMPDEAKSVRWIFHKYLELGAIGPLLRELDRAGITTRPRYLADGRKVGGGRFGKGGLNHLLKNRRYIGELVHRNEIYVAEHAAILDRDLFEAVQAKMAANNVKTTRNTAASPYLLTGLIFDSAGNRMSPVHTCKKGVRYRYYVSQAVAQSRAREAGVVARVPAPEIETLLAGLVAERTGVSGGMVGRGAVAAYIDRVSVMANALEVTLKQSVKSEQTGEFSPKKFSLSWNRKPFVVANKQAPATGADADAGGKSTTNLRAQGAVLVAIGQARLWLRDIVKGSSFSDISQREGKCERQIRLLLPLAFVPPATVRRLVEGTLQPGTVTAMARSVPLLWT